MHTSRPDVRLTGAEAAGASLVAFLALAIVGAYLTDRAGLSIAPIPTVVVSAALSAAVFAWLWRDTSVSWGDLAAFGGTSGVVFFWLLWLAWPDLLPLGGGADLTHHLQLVDYLDRHWRLVHDPAIEAYLGEMVHYTPGAHLLVVLAGRSMGTDGFHAVYPVVALSVALKTGFVFLIARRGVRLKTDTTDAANVGLKPDTTDSSNVRPDTTDYAMPLALLAVVFLFLPRAFFIGSFTRYSYIAQVVSELFAIVMWWALVAWDERPSARALVVFTIAGAATFLTWPVFIGPPLAAWAIVVWFRRDRPVGDRLSVLIWSSVPIGLVAAVHAIGRLGWAKIIRTDANLALPAWSDFSWPLLALSLAGAIAAVATRRSRTTTLMIGLCAVQAAALFVLAKTNGAVVPYMAIKMAYLAIYPLAVSAALALAIAWQTAMEVFPTSISPATAGHYSSTAEAGHYNPGRVLAWAALAVLSFIVGRQTLDMPLQKLTVSDPLYQAGRWAREHADPACIDYIVADNHTAYWLHLAVTWNKRMSARTADDNTFIAREAIVRWIKPGGLPYAVADLDTIPKDVLAEHDEAARFGTSVVIKRRGPSSCAPD